ncbi:hypothetical protein CFC21_072993 [Triticum aestivum]|uniref:Endonuclease/exonuclease/phosphatase domain-containing protein n=2 Tax=Triticum aestivum TaxID=4565 RepID=A0A9R1KUS2_WHEAT|nr:hypothetical protein CFC21_072988 [Triticum aestivum]KAF7067075.1 hypothetical protein CFC21_072993 [Triticum aestivum]
MSTSDVKIKLLTYNVWSNEHVAVYRRMQSISDLIASHDPDIIFLQEVTCYIKDIIRRSPWWRQYREFTRPAPGLILLTKLHKVDPRHIDPGPAWLRPPPTPEGFLSAFLDSERGSTDTNGVEHDCRLYLVCCDHRLHVATCSPEPTQSAIRSVDRINRAHEYLGHFGKCSISDHNVVLAGDMNWDDDLDGPFPIPVGSGWVDAWCELRGGDGAGGWTYDSVANPMLRGFKPGRTRPDRFLCKLRDFDLDSIRMVGTEAIPGVTYYDDKGDVLPVLPSHRFGLLLTISPKQA